MPDWLSFLGKLLGLLFIFTLFVRGIRRDYRAVLARKKMLGDLEKCADDLANWCGATTCRYCFVEFQVPKNKGCLMCASARGKYHDYVAAKKALGRATNGLIWEPRQR